MNESNNFNQGQVPNSGAQLSNTQNVVGNGMNTTTNQNVVGNGMNTTTNQNMFNNTASPKVEGPKSKWIIISILVILLIIIVLLYLFVFKKEDDEVLSNDDKTKENIKYSDNIVYESEIVSFKTLYDDEKYLVIDIKNKNNKSVECDLSVEFYDASNNLLKTYEDSIYHFDAKKDNKLVLDLYDIKNFDSYKIYINATATEFTKSFINDIEIKKTDNGKIYSIQLFNKSSKVIDYISGVAIFYKEGKISYIDKIIESELLPERSKNESYEYIDEDGDVDFEFDNCEVIINEAYSYINSD